MEITSNKYPALEQCLLEFSSLQEEQQTIESRLEKIKKRMKDIRCQISPIVDNGNRAFMPLPDKIAVLTAGDEDGVIIEFIEPIKRVDEKTVKPIDWSNWNNYWDSCAQQPSNQSE